MIIKYGPDAIEYAREHKPRPTDSEIIGYDYIIHGGVVVIDRETSEVTIYKESKHGNIVTDAVVIIANKDELQAIMKIPYNDLRDAAETAEWIEERKKREE